MWKYKVVKRMRGIQGQWFDFPTAATFSDLETARAYAEKFAREQGLAGVRGARIEVRSRRRQTVDGWPTHLLTVYKSDDYRKS